MFKEQEDIQNVFSIYEKSLLAAFEQYSKFDSKDPSKLSYNSYIKMGGLLKITPTIVSS